MMKPGYRTKKKENGVKNEKWMMPTGIACPIWIKWIQVVCISSAECCGLTKTAIEIHWQQKRKQI